MNEKKSKTFYFMKTPVSWLDQPVLKKLRKIAGGDTYLVIYLKMLLTSVKEEGAVFFESLGDDFADELALKLDEDIENVRVVLAFLEKYGLIEKRSEVEYFFPEAYQNIGSRSESADRVQEWRLSKKARLTGIDSQGQLPEPQQPGGEQEEQESEVRLQNLEEEEEFRIRANVTGALHVTELSQKILKLNQLFPTLNVGFTKKVQGILESLGGRDLVDDLYLEMVAKQSRDGAAFVAKLAAGDLEAEYLALPLCETCGRHVERLNDDGHCAACGLAAWKARGDKALSTPMEVSDIW